MHVGSLAPSTSHPPFLFAGEALQPPSSLRPHLCTPPLLCGISFAPPLCFAPSTLHPPSILRPLLCGDKRISKTKESKRIFSCKNRSRYSRKRATFCRNFANRRSLTSPPWRGRRSLLLLLRDAPAHDLPAHGVLPLRVVFADLASSTLTTQRVSIAKSCQIS